ncbi:hypothetical protein N7462_003121 [Penicillium macrosclerotiorum]|uniref:uncharacterized protein n=1 Tax=Penicillium macrosclerotiorum TaxID=303699 RepID=UPI002546AE8B|nr:uncharacterized protein N7462_003121 [Penicillium macrosclerotiorum]KAJ5688729.1 hypothetical protein N7462_003121 [Penicillium macrosclerotiorum]
MFAISASSQKYLGTETRFCQSSVQLFLSQCLPQWSSLDPRSWVALLGDLPSTIDALELSSIAVSAAVVGRMIQNTNLVRESLTYYTLGLRQLQRALNKANLAQEDGTLAACMALSLYEALECPNSASKGYYEHCNGLMALIQIRGAHAHSLGAGHKLFLGVRIPGILHALNHNSSTILSEPIWMEQPWSILPKLPFDRVADCLAKAPGILNRVPLLFSLDPNQQLDLIRELVYQCLEIDMALKQIDDDLRLATSGDLYWPVSSKMKLNPLDDNHSGSNYFPITFNFIDLEIAKTLILLWATWTMLWSGLCNLYQHFDIIAAAGGL